jgi:hypothetical protein
MPRRRRGPLEILRAGEAKEALGPDDRRSEEALVRFPIGAERAKPKAALTSAI